MTQRAKRLFSISLLLSLFFMSLPASAKVRIYILAGQSNMMGKGQTYHLPATYKRQPHNVRFYYQGRPQPLARFSHFGPEVSFAHEIARALPNDTHIIIKHVATGSSITQWLPGSLLFNGMLRQRRFIKKDIDVEENNLKVDAVIWMQGERDARTRHNATSYEGNLKRFILGLRLKLESTRSPFIMGQINPEDPAFSMMKTVQKAQQNTQRSLPNITLVSTNGLGKIYDHVHYDSKGQIELGRRFARAFINAKKY